MAVSLIAAVADNGVIGYKGGIPWRCPEDMERFRVLTTGHPVIMGRRTFDSLPNGKLPGRMNIVVCKWPAPRGDLCFDSLIAAVGYCERNNLANPFVIGGAKIYEEALQYLMVERAYITRIHCSPNGDTYFPLDRLNYMKKTREVHFRASAPERPDYTFEDWIWIK